MAKPEIYLAIDLGAESGRAILGSLEGGRLALSEIHRFANQPVRTPDGLHWDVLRLWSEIKHGLCVAASMYPESLASIGLDAWGVDYALLDRSGALLANPYHYRDSRNDGMLEEALRRLSREEIFGYTGIQFMQINTLCQLLSLVVSQSPLLEAAHTFLMIPDLFSYWLSGRQACELTEATTSQCYDPRQAGWACSLLEKMGIPTSIFPQVVQPGTVLGALLPDVAEEADARPIPVIATASHDTGAAVAAVPAQEPHFAWISSGTWSIMGAEVTAPVITPQALAFNLTNEGGVAGTWRLSKNIMGLWLVQECKRTWARQGEDLSYDELTRLAAEAEPFQAVIDPDDPDFLPHGDMPARIRSCCQRTGQTTPTTKGQVLRCVLESVALKYRWVLERLEAVLDYRLDPIYIIGGGSKNGLLNQLAADATGRLIRTGPVEATATGNILMQAVALGRLGSVQEAREVVRNSYAGLVYEPRPHAAWEAEYGKLAELVKTP